MLLFVYVSKTEKRCNDSLANERQKKSKVLQDVRCALNHVVKGWKCKVLDKEKMRKEDLQRAV